MLTPDPSRNVGIADALKLLLSTIDSAVDPETINNLTLEAVQEKVLTAISKNPISSDVISQFSNLFYGSNSPLVKEQSNTFLNRIKDQNVQENFKQAKIRFMITTALCKKLIKEAQIRAAREQFQRKVDKARWKKDAGYILRAGKYWEELAEFDRMGEEKLLELIKKQHQEAMNELRGLKATIILLKRQLKEIDKYENQVLNVYSKEIAADLKAIKFKDGTSLFKNVSDQEIEETSREYIKKDYDASKKIEELHKETEQLKQEKSFIEKQIRKDTQPPNVITTFSEKRTTDNMEGLAAPPAMLLFKKHQDHTRKSENTHHLSERLKAITATIASNESKAHLISNERDNLLLEIVKKSNKPEIAKQIETHGSEFKEIINQKIKQKKEAAHNELNFYYTLRKETTEQLNEVKETARHVMKKEKEILNTLHRGSIDNLTVDSQKILEEINNLNQEMDEFDLEDDEDLELEVEEKTRPRL